MKGLKGSEIFEELKNVLGESALSHAAVKNWVAEFKRGRTSVHDEYRSGRPKSVTTPEMISKVHEMILQNRRLKLSEIANSVSISKERIHHILSEKLHMKKLSARWVPRLLTLDQKRIRMQDSQHCLNRFQRNKVDFLQRFVTTDETWVHHYTPESKIQSKQWTEAGCSAPKKAKAVKSAGKVMASVFWDAKGILMIDYLPRGQTITGDYYADLLHKLQECIQQKRPGLARKKIIFHQDNARVHTCVKAMAKINELHYELLPHPPYSPDLAPSDFHLFPKLKNFLGGRKFETNDAVIAAVEEYFAGLEETHFMEGITALERRWTKCVELKGDYVEK